MFHKDHRSLFNLAEIELDRVQIDLDPLILINFSGTREQILDNIKKNL